MSDKAMFMFCCLLASSPVWADVNQHELTGILFQPSGFLQEEPIDILFRAAKAGDIDTVRRLLVDEEIDLNEDVDGRALLAASAHNHVTIVELLLAHGADPAKKVTNEVCSALGYAVRNGYQDIVRILLDNGAQPAALDCYKRCPKLTTPLHLAVLEGNFDMVKLLCEYPTTLEKSLINSKDEFGDTPLHDAVSGERFSFFNCYIIPEENFLQIANYLIERGADIHVQNNDDGSTPLHQAAAIASLPHCKLLVSHGADVNATDNENLTPLHYACEEPSRGSSSEEYVNVCSFLLEHGAKINARSCDGLTPLHVAAQSGRSDLIDYLVNHGTDVNAVDTNQNTPLNHAVKYLISEYDSPGSDTEKIMQTIEALLQHGADIRIADCNGKIPDPFPLLLAAARIGDHTLAEELVASGATIGEENSWDTSALMQAVYNENTDVVRVLLGHGARATESDQPGAPTPLHKAAEIGNLEIVKLLCEYPTALDTALINVSIDADEFRDHLKRTPLHDAANYGHFDVVSYPVRQGADVNAQDGSGETPLSKAARYNYDDVARYLIKHGAHINMQDNDGQTPLHKALQGSRHLSTVKLLVNAGADICAQDHEGYLPLHHACTWYGYEKHYDPASDEQVDVCNFLINHGAPVNTRTKNDSTPLHKAIRSNTQVVDLLIRAGADINALDKWQETPLHRAVGLNNITCVKKLVQNGADLLVRNNEGLNAFDVAQARGNAKVTAYLRPYYEKIIMDHFAIDSMPDSLMSDIIRYA